MMLRRDTRYAFYQPHVQYGINILSFQVVAELYRGALDAGWGSVRLSNLDSLISQYLVVHSTDGIVAEWARIRHEGGVRGRLLGPVDAWIAATAAGLNAPLLTHDADFNSISCPGVTVIRYDDTVNLCP
jgi:predicted nucleic acid-binding protein